MFDLKFRCFAYEKQYLFACFSQLVRSKFSTRAFKSKKKASLFQLKKRRYLDRKSDAFFFALFRTTRKVRPNVFEYQCVAMAIFAREIWPKITAFSALSLARVLRNIDFSKHRKSSKIKNRQKEHYYTCRVQYEISS